MTSPNQCELCSSSSGVSSFEVPLSAGGSFENRAQICSECRDQIESQDFKPSHWHGLRENIWTENPAVKVLAWRVLNRLTSETWAQDLLEQLYLEDDLLAWAQAGAAKDDQSSADAGIIVKDSNGTVLQNGDSVTLIKDLDVKGAGFTAKRGTLVKNIVLTDDPGLIEGRVNGTQIVLKTQFLKKA